MKINNKAFTLAEVLITLGIIGIVAALTMPMLMASYRKHVTINKLKKAYTVLNQAYMLSFEDNGEPENISNLKGEKYFEKYWQPYVNKSTYCKTYRVCGYSSVDPFVTSANAASSTSIVWENMRTTFYVPDGMIFSIWYGTIRVGNPSYDILVDINGSQAPNRLGEDVFFFTRNPEKRVVYTRGYNLSDSELNTECKTKGYTCASKIIRDGWEIKSDYPISFR